MRDDDDAIDDEQPAGKLLHSGIRAEDSVEPADYALPGGVRALQENHEGDDAGAPVEKPGFAPDRRRFITLAAGGLAIGVSSFLFGRGSAAIEGQRHRQLGARLTQKQLKRIRAAHVWADDELETLVAAAPSFLWVFRVVEPDAKLLHGLFRLCEYSVNQGGGRKGFETAVEILGTFEHVAAPPGFDRFREDLEDLVWQWHVKQRAKGF